MPRSSKRFIARQRSGEGATLSISLFDATAEWMAVPLLHHEYGGQAPERMGLRHPSIAPYGAYSTARRQGDRHRRSRTSGSGGAFAPRSSVDAALAADPRFRDNNRRVANRGALDALVAEVFAREPRAALAQRLKAADIAFGNLNTVADFAAHPHLRRLATPTPEGMVDVPAPPALATDTAPRAVPGIGEHSDAIRREFTT